MHSLPNSEVSSLKSMIDNYRHNNEVCEVYENIYKLYTQKLNLQTICKKVPETHVNQTPTPLAHEEAEFTC
jgi:uncharacterized protein involved in tolerance to divalent cations